jgi:hypothetical protein
MTYGLRPLACSVWCVSLGTNRVALGKQYKLFKRDEVFPPTSSLYGLARLVRVGL